MKRSIIVIFALVCLSLHAISQNQLGKADDLARISLTAIVPDELDHIPANARKLLTNKLSNVVARNGASGTATNPRFVITANIDILTKDITPTAPPKTALTLSVTFYIADVVEQSIFSSTILEVKGVGDNETKAYTAAIDRIAPQNPKLRALIEEGKNKIIEYYNSQCDFILKDAQTKADTRDYGHAIYILSSVPTVCKECYDKAATLIPTIYQQYIDYSCTDNLAKAKAFFAKKDMDNAYKHLAEILPDSKCYEEASSMYTKIEQDECNRALAGAKAAWARLDPLEAAEHLAQITQSCNCFAEAEKLQKEIHAKIKADQQREWERKIVKEDRAYILKKKQIENEPEIAKARMQAAASIATAALQSNTWGYYNNLRWIFGR